MQEEEDWVRVQKKTFTRWCNAKLGAASKRPIGDLYTDLSDGTQLLELLEALQGKPVGRYSKSPKTRFQKLENCNLALSAAKGSGVPLVGIGAEDIVDPKPKLILGLIWSLIKFFECCTFGDPDSNARSGVSDLIKWLQQRLPDRNITNLTSDWGNGENYMCLNEALKPGAFNLPEDFTNTQGNKKAAYDDASSRMGIPALLDPTDPVDELSNYTYLVQFRHWWEAHKDDPVEEEAAAAPSEPVVAAGEPPEDAYCHIYNKERDYYAAILEDGTCVNAAGTVIGYLNVEGQQAANAAEQFLGYISGDQVYDKDDEEVGEINRGTGQVFNEYGSTLVKMNGQGECSGNTEVYLGQFGGFNYSQLPLIALWVHFIDPSFAKEDE